MIIRKTLTAILGIIVVIQIGILAYLFLGWPPSTANFLNKAKATETVTTVTKTSSPSTQLSSTPELNSTTETSSTVEQTTRIPKEKWLTSQTPIHFPILMYHSLTESEGNSLKIPPAEFRQHLEYLKEAGYYTLTPDEAYLVLTENKKPAEKIVWLTFDDGYLNNYLDGFPLLKEFKMNGTINYITAKEGHENYFNLNQMKEMATSGFVNIESHTVNHLEVNVMDYDQQFAEFSQSKKYLDQNLNQNTTVLCYPAGRYDEHNFKALTDAGYKMALTTENGYASSEDGLFALKRVRVSPGFDKIGFGNLINSFQ